MACIRKHLEQQSISLCPLPQVSRHRHSLHVGFMLVPMKTKCNRSSSQFRIFWLLQEEETKVTELVCLCNERLQTVCQQFPFLSIVFSDQREKVISLAMQKQKKQKKTMSANGSQVNGSLFWVGGPNSFGVREIFLIEVYMIKIMPASGEAS